MSKGDRILVASLSVAVAVLVAAVFTLGAVVGATYKGRTLRAERDAARAEVVRLRGVVFGPVGTSTTPIPDPRPIWNIDGREFYVNIEPVERGVDRVAP